MLENKRRNRLAWDLLVALSVGVDDLAMRSRKLDLKALSPREDLFRQYLQAVREGSDTEVNRRKRHDIICGLVEPIFERKTPDAGSARSRGGYSGTRQTNASANTVDAS